MGGKGFAIIVAAFFTIALAYSVRYGYGMLLPGMVETLGISKTEAGLISSAYFCAYTVFSPLLGALSDRVSGRLLLTTFCGLLATATLCMAYVNTVGAGGHGFCPGRGRPCRLLGSGGGPGAENGAEPMARYGLVGGHHGQ
jgi:MFS family permease